MTSQWASRIRGLNYTYNRSHSRYLRVSQIHLRNDFTLFTCMSLIQSLVSCHKSLCLLICLHFEISSVLLLRMLFPLNNAISSFSFRKRLHLSDKRLNSEQEFSTLFGRQNFYVSLFKILSKVQYHSYMLLN